MNAENVNPFEQLIAMGAPAEFSSTADEWRAARQECAVFPALHRAIARVSGDDRESFLHGMLTNDVRMLAPGSGLPAAFLTDSGKVVADLRLYRDEEGLDLDCLSWRLDNLCNGLEKYIIADDVEIERSADRAPLVCLEGPRSGSVAMSVFGAGADLPAFGGCAARLAGEAVVLYAVSDTGGPGLLVVGPEALRDRVLAACRQAGAAAAGMRALDVLRVEAGIPWVGIDTGDDTLLMEIGLPETISRTKGCYLGQEIVERVSARGQVNRTLTAFVIDADLDQLPAGSLAVHADPGGEVGRVTSRVQSPSLGAVLGMGLLHRKGREAAVLQVIAGERSYPCRVADFPHAARS